MLFDSPKYDVLLLFDNPIVTSVLESGSIFYILPYLFGTAVTKYDIRYVLIPKEFSINTGFIGEKLGHGKERWGYSGGGFNRYYKESGKNYCLYPENFVLIKEDDYYKLYQIFLKGN